MKRQRIISIIPSALNSRNKWARRGRNLVHFTMSILFVISSYIADAIIAVIKFSIKIIFKKDYLQKNKPMSNESIGLISEPFHPLKETPDITFDDIAGLETAKEQITQRMILPVLYPKEAEDFKVKKGGGILLFGPPGVGKTMLAKAVANQINADFFEITPKDIVRSGVGDAETRISQLFRFLRQHKKAVLFLDDVDGLLPSRSRNNSTIMRRVISQFLIETDGVECWPKDNVLLIIGATNEPDMIDSAIKRPGRFDVKIYVGLPEKEARFTILNSLLKERPVIAELNIEELAEKTQGYSGADLGELVNRVSQQAFSRSIKRKKGELVSPIAQNDFQLALQEIGPSVSINDLKRFQ